MYENFFALPVLWRKNAQINVFMGIEKRKSYMPEFMGEIVDVCKKETSYGRFIKGSA